MIESIKKYSLFFVFLFLLTTCIFVYYLDFRENRRTLTFAILDIGQGDAIFIESPTGVQLFFDGGPPGKINSKIKNALPFYDKNIDALFATHPDADHVGGFDYLVKNYKIKYFFESGVLGDSLLYSNLKKEVEKNKITSLNLDANMKLHIGGGAYIEIIFPDRDVTFWDTNEGSMVARLVYGEHEFLLTGDIGAYTEKILVDKGVDIKSDFLKVGHHGSRGSTRDFFLEKVDPEYALVSVGLKNNYGHPHPDVLSLLEEKGVETLRTDMLGSIVIKSDGENLKFKFHK